MLFFCDKNLYRAAVFKFCMISNLLGFLLFKNGNDNKTFQNIVIVKKILSGKLIKWVVLKYLMDFLTVVFYSLNIENSNFKSVFKIS